MMNAGPEGVKGFEAITGELSQKERLLFDTDMVSRLWQCAALGVALVWIAGDCSNRVSSPVRRMQNE